MTTRTKLRAEALKAGQKTFLDPKGCKRGHTVFRTSNMACMTCEKTKARVTAVSFTAFALNKNWTSGERLAAMQAWIAAGGMTPNLEHEVVRMAADGGVSSTRLQRDLGVTGRNARRLILALRNKGRLYKTEHYDGHAPIWKDVK